MPTRSIVIDVTKRVSVDLYVTTCPSCHVVHAIPDEMRDRCDRTGDNWYCPNGHSIVFTKTREAALTERNEALADEAERLRRDNLRLSDDLMTNAKEMRRIKRRIKAGVCTDCHRHFENLERHQKTKHSAA